MRYKNPEGQYAFGILLCFFDELLAAFKAEQKKVRPAVEAMLADAENAAKGSSEYSTYDDVFGVRE